MKHKTWQNEIASHGSKETPKEKDKDKLIRPKVINRLQILLMGNESTLESCSELVSYFIQRWSSAETGDRDSAVQAFKAIITQPPPRHRKRSSVSDVEQLVDAAIKQENEGGLPKQESIQTISPTKSSKHKPSFSKQSSLLTTAEDSKEDCSYTWLHEKLPTLKYFSNVLEDVKSSMRQALSVEMDIRRIQAYLKFLSTHLNPESEEDGAPLMQDLSH
jgi:hypothetical protein